MASNPTRRCHSPCCDATATRRYEARPDSAGWVRYVYTCEACHDPLPHIYTTCILLQPAVTA